MGLLSRTFWTVGDCLLVVLIALVCRRRFRKTYPYLLAYVACEWIVDFLRMYVHAKQSETVYSYSYWITEWVLAFVGFGLMWEIYRQAFFPYSGLRRMARAILTTLLGTIAINDAVQAFDGAKAFGETSLDFARNLEVIEAILLVALVSLIVQYRVPLGRNVRLLLLGFGLYLGSNIITRTLRAHSGDPHADWWSIPTQVEYCVTLVIWCVGLWSYAPNPVPGMELERDYERVAAQTIRAFGRLRHHLIHSWRSQ